MTTTPDDDRGRELAELLSLADTAIGVAEQTLRDGKVASREVVTEWRGALGRLRAPAETEAGDLAEAASEIDLVAERVDCDPTSGHDASTLRETARDIRAHRCAATPPAPKGEAGSGELLQELFHALTTVQPWLSQPYPDDPRWSPWSRWIEPVFDRLCTAISATPVAPQAEGAAR